MRSNSEIAKEEERLLNIIWWNRHKVLEKQISEGKTQGDSEVWDKACVAAAAIERAIPEEERELDDLGWGMVNGKLSALRWVLGYEWDMLDT